MSLSDEWMEQLEREAAERGVTVEAYFASLVTPESIAAVFNRIAPPCTCGRIKVGMTVTESRNWNPDCAEHGVTSEWYRSPEQVAKRQAQNDRLRNLLGLAREARRAGPTIQHNPQQPPCDTEV